MTNTLLFARITEVFCQTASKPIPLIKGPQRQKTGIRTDLSTRKIGTNEAVSVEGKGELWYITRCHFEVLRKRMPGSAKTQCSSIF
jgi:hypothetical protein